MTQFKVIKLNGFWRVQNVETGKVLPAAYLEQDKSRAEHWAMTRGVLVD